MSRIYFNSKDDEAQLRGSERAHFGYLIGNLFVAALQISDWDRHPLKPYAASWVRDRDTAELYFRGISCPEIAGYEAFALQLNTAISMGSDYVKLAAYIHGTAETHGRFEPEDFEWVISTINQGLDAGFYRQDQGWDEVLALFKSNPGAIVMSYSVTDGFPNTYLVGADDDISDDALWDQCLEHIRNGNYACINQSTGLFSHEMNAFQLIDQIQAETKMLIT